MANKKEDKVSGQSLEPVITTLEEAPVETTLEEQAAIEQEEKKEVAAPKSNLLPCTVARDFSDGNIAEEFGKLGYGVEWIRGEKRNLPMRLIERVRNSGGEIELLRG